MKPKGSVLEQCKKEHGVRLCGECVHSPYMSRNEKCLYVRIRDETEKLVREECEKEIREWEEACDDRDKFYIIPLQRETSKQRVEIGELKRKVASQEQERKRMGKEIKKLDVMPTPAYDKYGRILTVSEHIKKRDVLKIIEEAKRIS